MIEVLKLKKFNEEDAVTYSKIWDNINPIKNKGVSNEVLQARIDESILKIEELNNMTNVPINVYYIYLPFLDAQKLIQNGVVDLEFSTAVLPTLMLTFSHGLEMSAELLYHISEEFSWDDSCKFTDKAIKILHLLCTIQMDSRSYQSKKNIANGIRAFTTYFPDEIVETTSPEYLLGHSLVLYNMANGIPIEEGFKDAVVECLIIALEAGLDFTKHLVVNNYIEAKVDSPTEDK